MKKSMALTGVVLLVACLWGVSALRSTQPQSSPQSPSSQACAEDKGIVTSVTQDLSSLVDTVKKESQQDFDTKYHEQTCISRLSICSQMTGELVECLTKASKDASTPKEQMSEIQTLLASYTKLKSTLDQDLQTLKGVKNNKAAKAAIAGFDFSH
ncbi:MAG: hypothetical protein ACRD3D_11145 [Terriglobia bacterium]